MKILQLGKFYPIRGGVEKVMWDLTRGLDAAGVPCDMLCASLKPGETEELLRMPDIDGGLIGGASLKIQDFLRIIETAAAIEA